MIPLWLAFCQIWRWLPATRGQQSFEIGETDCLRVYAFDMLNASFHAAFIDNGNRHVRGNARPLGHCTS